MRYRTFGDSDVTASEIGFGLWTVSTGWWGEVSDDAAVDLIRKAFDAGITLFDSADAYAEGRADRLLAKALAAHRDEITLATKFGYDIFVEHDRTGHRERPHNWDPAFLRRNLEETLTRLETDRIDVYQLHNPRMDAVQRDDVWALLDDLAAEGKIRIYGVAMGPAIGWRDEGIAAIERRDRMRVFHHIFNLLEQRPGADFNELCRERGIGVMVRVPHSSGLLEGKYDENTTFDEDDHRSHRKREWLTEGLAKLSKLEFLVTPERTIGQAALRWILSEPAVTSVLPNIYDEAQLAEFASASDLPELSEEELAAVAELYERNFDLEATPTA
ncbi:MAG: aldo/keto reductase [Actinobacteria bacterium]|nr:aldo/keto reductase [Actinomycetota bacterium]